MLLSKLTPNLYESTTDRKYGFRRNRGAINHTLCFHEMLDKNAIRQYLSYLQTSVRREDLGNTLTASMELVRLMKTCLKEACSKVRTGEHLSRTYSIRNGP